MNFSLIGNMIASGKSTLILNLYNELELSAKISSAMEPLIDSSLDEFYGDLKIISFFFQYVSRNCSINVRRVS
jgi:deoxyadenosine/deoxycytidine kinase